MKKFELDNYCILDANLFWTDGPQCKVLDIYQEALKNSDCSDRHPFICVVGKFREFRSVFESFSNVGSQTTNSLLLCSYVSCLVRAFYSF